MSLATQICAGPWYSLPRSSSQPNLACCQMLSEGGYVRGLAGAWVLFWCTKHHQAASHDVKKQEHTGRSTYHANGKHNNNLSPASCCLQCCTLATLALQSTRLVTRTFRSLLLCANRHNDAAATSVGGLDIHVFNKQHSTWTRTDIRRGAIILALECLQHFSQQVSYTQDVAHRCNPARIILSGLHTRGQLLRCIDWVLPCLCG